MRYSREDLEVLLEALDRHGRILVSDHELGLPTIHEVSNAQHLWMGMFSAETPEWKVGFDGGGAMQRTSEEGISWCPLIIHRGEYPYDVDAVRDRILELIDEIQ